MMTKAAFVSGLQTEQHCDVQGSSAHIRVFVGGHEAWPVQPGTLG